MGLVQLSVEIQLVFAVDVWRNGFVPVFLLERSFCVLFGNR